MYKRIFLVLMIILMIATPIHATNWTPVNYSNPNLIKESGLTIEEFNNLTQSEWLELFNDKEKVNFAFSATNSNGEDITGEVNPNLSINVNGSTNSKTVSFQNLDLTPEETSNNLPDLSQFNNVIYVDSVNGSDYASGTESKPLKTFEKAVSKFNTGDAIKLKEGEYTNTLGSNNKNLTIIGENQNTQLYVSEEYFNGNVTVNLYNLVIEYNPNLYAFARNINEINAYNTVFHTTGERGAFYAISYSKTMNITLENCSIEIEDHHLSNHSKVFYGQELDANIKNVSTNTMRWYSTDIYHHEIKNLSKTTSILETKYDSNYNITSSGWQNSGTGTNPDNTQAHIGVYGGEFAW